MTTGSRSEGTGYPSPGAASSKAWNGADGWYEIYHGRVRVKVNAYHMTSSRESPQIGGLSLFCTAGGSSSSWGSQPFLPWTSRDEFELQSKLVKRIKGHDFNLAVNVAQMNQTVSLCADTLRKMTSSIKALKHGNPASAVRLLFGADGGKLPKGKLQGKLKGKDVSSQWLELQYGWLPMIGDCYEAAKAFENYSSARKTSFTVKLRKREPYEGSAAPTNYSCPGIATTFRKIKCELYEDLALPRSLGLMDPLSVAWEIIPYSFVVDWFIPIGGYLENLAILPNVKGRFTSTLYQQKQAAYKYGLVPAYKNVSIRRAFFANQLDRSVSESIPTQKPTFINGPACALSARRIFSAIALGHQRIKDFPGQRPDHSPSGPGRDYYIHDRRQ